MERTLYRQMAAIEKKHWWFLARRTIIKHLLKRLKLPIQSQILEVGCGTGGNLAMLSEHGQVYAMEINEVARQFAYQSGCATIRTGALPDNIPFEKEQFDLIVLLDVLEHLQEDLRSLQNLHSYLKSDGWLLITVPALPILWSEHDEKHHHYRRYIKKELADLLKKAGFKVLKLSYFNFFLFPVIFMIRYWHRLIKKQHNALKLPPIYINWLLIKIFASERYLMNVIGLPIGVSLILLAQKRNA
jgi:SAM-dependent methyltransferase